MYADKSLIEDRLLETDLVLDLGSWNDIFPRANVIIDVNPYETRKNRYPDDEEMFTRNSWFQSDINLIETWEKFKDKQFDFVVCSHLLEDVRDPLFVCEQMIRVAKAGYIEVPTRYRECSRATKYDTVSGYDHHRWIIDVNDGDLNFTAKLHWAHTIDYLGDERRDLLRFHNFHYFGLFWDDTFSFSERCPKGEELEGANLLYLFEKLDISSLKELDSLITKASSNSFLWVDKFVLPLEMEDSNVIDFYKSKYSELSSAAQKDFIEKIRLQELLSGAEQRVVDLQEKLAVTEVSLSKILRSSSWQITSPLRRIKGFVSRASK